MNKRTGKFFIAQNQYVLLASTVQGPSQESSFFRFYELPLGRVLIESIKFPGQFVSVQQSTTSKSGLALVSRKALPSTTEKNLFIMLSADGGCRSALPHVATSNQAKDALQDILAAANSQAALTVPQYRNDGISSIARAFGHPTPALAPERNGERSQSDGVIDSVLAVANANAAGRDSLDIHRGIVDGNTKASPITVLLPQFYSTDEPRALTPTESATTEAISVMARERDSGERRDSRSDQRHEHSGILEILQAANEQAAG